MSAITDLDKALVDLAEVGAAAEWGGPYAAEQVNVAEQKLGVRFPESYREFLRRVGTAGVGAVDVYGLVGDLDAAGAPNVVWLTLRLREEFDVPERYVPVVSLDDGSDYALDCARIAPQENECPVTRIWPNGAESGFETEDVAQNFGIFLRGLVAPAIE